MFWLDAHILRASSSTVCACTSKRPAIDRISCGSVIKRVGISPSPYPSKSSTALNYAVLQRYLWLLTGSWRSGHHDGTEPIHRLLHLVVDHAGYPAPWHTGHAQRPNKRHRRGAAQAGCYAAGARELRGDLAEFRGPRGPALRHR